MARAYLQGRFTPKHPSKYIGDPNNIVYRSSWELKFMKWADNNPSVVRWNSEEVILPYISPLDMKPHRYFVDFAIQVKNNSGDIKSYLVEIKPEAQTMPPKRGKRKTDKYLQDLSTYEVNQAKWKQASSFCKKNGMEFIVLTEKHLF